MVGKAEPGISLVIPAWNEALRLRRTLERYLPVLAAQGVPFECIVVVDGANDGTADVVTAFADRGARLLSFSYKLGKGGAIFKGFDQARYTTVGFVDADGPVDEREFSQILALAQRSDCVVGTRGLFHHADNMSRNLAGVFWSLLVRVLFPDSVSDTQCGLKFFQRHVLDEVTQAVGLTNFAFDVSLLHHVQLAGYDIQEMPFHWINGRGSQLHLAKSAPFMLASLIGVRLSNPPFSRFLPRAMLEWLRRMSARVGPRVPASAATDPEELDAGVPAAGWSAPRVSPLARPPTNFKATPPVLGSPPSLLPTPPSTPLQSGAMDGPDVPVPR